MTHYDKNIVTDFSCPIDGTTSCATAFDAWIDFLKGLSAGDTWTLTIPVHSYNMGDGSGTYRGSFCAGVLGGTTGIIECGGASFTGNFPALGFWRGSFEDNTHSTRASTIAAGATSATVADSSIFSVSQWVLIAGIDTQDNSSAPPNPRLYEYRKLTGISGSVISWAEPLINTYKSTWPLYDAGGAFNYDQGGPATVYAMPIEFDVQVTYNAAGASFHRSSGGTDFPVYVKCRSVTVNGAVGNKCTFVGEGVIPTQCVSLTLSQVDNGDVEAEVDKIWSTFSSSNTDWTQIKIQSGAGEASFTSDTVAASFNGLSRKTTLTNCTLGGQLQYGPTEGYGFCEQLRISGGSIVGPLVRPNVTDDIVAWEWLGGGVFRVLNGTGNGSAPYHVNEPVIGIRRLTIIGAWFFFYNNRFWGNPFQVTDAWQDATYTYVQTTLPSVPTFNAGASGFPLPDRYAMATCLQAWSSGVSSSDNDVLALNNAPQGRPIGEYNERTISGVQDGSTGYQMPIYGALSKIEVDVTQACVKSGACTLNVDQFGVWTIDSTNTVVRLTGRTVDCKTAGLRTIYPGSVTGSVGADSLSPMSGLIMDNLNPAIVTDTSGASQQAVVTVRVFTNTGVTFSEVLTDNRQTLLGAACM